MIVNWLEKVSRIPGVVEIAIGVLALVCLYEGLEHGQTIGHWMFR